MNINMLISAGILTCIVLGILFAKKVTDWVISYRMDKGTIVSGVEMFLLTLIVEIVLSLIIGSFIF